MSRASGFDPGDGRDAMEGSGSSGSAHKRSRIGEAPVGSDGRDSPPLNSVQINKTEEGRVYSSNKKEREKEKEKGEKTKGKKKVPGQDKYEYKTLSELAEVLKINLAKKDNYRNYECNTYGVVISFTQPKLCTGKAAKYNKYQASYFLADPSRDETFESNVNMNVFGNSLDDFPYVRSVGDVLRCHRVTAQFYQGLQLCGPKNQCKFVTFHRKTDPTTGLDNKSSGLGDAYHGDRHYNTANMLNKVRLTNLDQLKYGVYSTSKEFTFVQADHNRVTQYTTWATARAACLSLKDRMTDMLSLKGAMDSFQRNKGVDDVSITSDLIAVFVGVIGPAGSGNIEKPADGAKAVFWDGTLPGNVGVTEAETETDLEITPRTLQALNQSMHSSSVYGETNMVLYEEFETLRDRVVLPAAERGAPMVYSGVTSFHVTEHFAQLQFARMVPGTWVRMRNLSILSTNNRFTKVDAPVINSETHVISLAPYALDPMDIARTFKVKVNVETASAVSAQGANYRQATHAAAQRLQEGEYDHAAAVEIVADSIRESEPAQGDIVARAPEAPRSRASVSDTGEELTSLTLIQGTPAPAKFCCRSKITNYYPRDLSRWVVNLSHFREQIIDATGGDTSAVPRWAADDKQCPANGGGSSSSDAESLNVDELLSGVSLSAQPSAPKKAFLFSLSIADDTAETDVIFSGKDAQFFLNDTSPDKFNAALLGGDDGDGGDGTEQLVENIQRHLDAMIKDQSILQFYIRSYIDKTSDPNPNAKGLKRLSAYNTRLGGL